MNFSLNRICVTLTTKAFMQIRDPKLRRSIVNLVEQIAGSEDQ
jgi:hypothetical protein